MNILFVMYGDFSGNSAHPMALHARELSAMGHACAAAVPSGVDTASDLHDVRFNAVSYSQANAAPVSLFPNGRPADLIHAWTPREVVRRFVTSYLSGRPTPLVIYLEDNEEWIARASLALAGISEPVLHRHTEEVLSTWTPLGMPHVLRHRHFVGLADAAVVIQDKLHAEVPPWVPCRTVMPGVDLELFAPRERDAALLSRHGVREGEHAIVYPGGLNDFTRPGLEALCRAVGILNAEGTPCRLLRTGPVALDFLDRLPPEAAAAVTDAGTLPREELAKLLASADVLVQPGKPDAFEDLRLPGKLPELLATGRPVILPDTNIANLLRDGVDAVFHRTGSAEEIAARCVELFDDPARARRIGELGRRFAEAHFNPRSQANALEDVYRQAVERFDADASAQVWGGTSADAPIPLLLARKLRLMGGQDELSASAFAAHAECLERSHERICGLEQAIALRDADLVRLAKDVEDGGSLIVALRHQLAEFQEYVAAMRQQLAELQTELHEIRAADESLRATIAQRDDAIARLQSSFSWRLTAPLRVLGRSVSRLFDRGS